MDRNILRKALLTDPSAAFCAGSLYMVYADQKQNGRLPCLVSLPFCFQVFHLVPPAGIEPAQYRYRGILSVLHRLRSVQIGNDSLHNRRIYRCGLCNIEQFEKGCFGAHKHQTNTTIYDAYMPVAACAFCRILVYSDQGTVIRRQAVGLSLEKGG